MHWKHSKYQILHVILSNCHTYDEAYRVLRELEEDYDLSVKLASAEYNRVNAKEIAAKLIIKDTNESAYNKCGAKADLDSVAAKQPSLQSQMDVAVSTLKFIRKCIEVISPHRMFSHMSDADAHQACQYLEYKFDLIWKSYNMICATGNMSYDHFINVKMHPEADKLMAVVDGFLQVVRDGKHPELLKLTKSDVLGKVVNNDEKFIQSISTVFVGIQNDTNFPKLTGGNETPT